MFLHDHHKPEECLASLAFYYKNKDLINELPIPKLLDFSCDNTSCSFVYENIENSSNVADHISEWNDKDKMEILKGLVNIVSTLEKNKIYPRDIRTWNTLYQKTKNNSSKIYLIDFDLFYDDADKSKMLIDFLWLMYELNALKVSYIVRHQDMMLEPKENFGQFSNIAGVIQNKKIKTVLDLKNYLAN